MVPSGRTPLVLSGPGQPGGEQLFDKGCQTSAIVSIGCLPDSLGLSGIGMNDIGESLQADAANNGQTDFTDHLAGMAGPHFGRVEEGRVVERGEMWGGASCLKKNNT